MGFLSRDTLVKMGFSSLGQNVAISEKASIYNPQKITIGDNVRIDDFCVISAGIGGVSIGNHVHLALGCSLIGAGKITVSSFVNISSRVSIYSSNDDYSGASLTGPTIPEEYKKVVHADVFIGRHVVIGCGTVVLPGVTLEDGVAVGALSFVKYDCTAFGIYVGAPAKRIKERKRDLLELEHSLLQTKQVQTLDE